MRPTLFTSLAEARPVADHSLEGGAATWARTERGGMGLGGWNGGMGGVGGREGGDEMNGDFW